MRGNDEVLFQVHKSKKRIKKMNMKLAQEKLEMQQQKEQIKLAEEKEVQAAELKLK